MSTKATAMGRLAVEKGESSDHGKLSRGKQVGHFFRHLLEMCAAMCIGLGALTLPYIWAMGQAGYTDPIAQLPELTTLVAAFNMTAPMVVWMRIRKMAWRPIAEMSAAMLVEAIVLIGLYWFGFVPGRELFNLLHGLMMPAMLVPMLLRLDVYTGRAGCH